MCWIVAKVDGVKIRTGPGKNYTAVGQLPKGAQLSARCSATSGGSYTDCGSSYWWIEVYYGGRWGRYVAWGCVNWYSPATTTGLSDEDAAALEMLEEAAQREPSVPPVPEPEPEGVG
jgi:Bacterial SH3 domain